MARPVDKSRRYIIRAHKVGDKVYASTQPARIDEKTGKKVYRYIHWGRIVDNTFLPNETYAKTDPAERARLVFPKGLDTSAIRDFQCDGRRRVSRAVRAESGAEERLYGDVWLLMQIARRCGLEEALLSAFDHDEETVRGMLTLVCFQCTTGLAFDRAEAWQRIAAAPAGRALTSSRITALMRGISERRREDFLRIWAAKVQGERFCSVDTVTRSAYGNEADRGGRWDVGSGLGMKAVTEAVVYTRDRFMPVYYRL